MYYRESYVALSPLLLSASITPLSALHLFSLSRPAYSTGLGGLAPFVDLWVSLSTARGIAKRLGLQDLLYAFLESGSRGAWSVRDEEEGGLVHKLRLPL